MFRRAIAVTLICLSTGAVAQSPTAKDNRTPIMVTPSERNQVLYEMREFLHSLFNMHHALASKDMNAVAIATSPMKGLLERSPVSVRDKLPEEFIQIAIGMDEALKAMERDAKTKGDMSLTQTQMAELMSYCSGCHDTFRFEIVPARVRR